MIKFLKKPIGIISIIVVLGLAVGGYFYFGHEKKSEFDTAIAKQGDLVQEVSVTGRVKPASSVNLTFEKSGRVSRVYADVGKQVSAGQTLVVIENADIAAQRLQAEAGVESAKAQLEQYRAAFETQKAKLAELKRGTRPEEIQVQETKVENAKTALADAQKNLENVKAKATIDLQNLHDKIADIFRDAHLKADDAVRKQTDEMFDNDDTQYVQLTFLNTNSQAEIDAEWQRQIAGNRLNQWKEEIDSLPSDQNELDQALTASLEHLTIIQSFLNRLMDTINAAFGISQTTKTTYQTNVNTGRTNVNTAIEVINNQKQTIAAQKVLNQNNTTAAEEKLRTAESNLKLEESNLALKKAGIIEEQIAAQEAQVTQAEANIVSQQAQIKQAEANVENYQAQIAKTIIRAPISGTVTKQDAKVGEIVSANTPLVSLISASQFEIEANIPEADIAKVKLGNAAKVTLDAYGNDVSFDVKVVAIDPAETIIDGVATYKTTFQFIDKDERVKSGMTANIDISTEKRENVIVIPQRAVITKNGDKIVRVFNDETLKEVKVKTGLRGSDGNIEIIESVSEGDKVIIYFE